MDKMKMQSKDRTQENYEKLAALFPNAVTETITGYDEDGNAIIERAIDKDVLQQEISAVVVEGRDERYQFTWPDKKKSILAANAPIRKTLRPCREESVDFDNTENLYIEGDNLDVLKLLQETYLGKVKMIYIDPPYNIGSDLIYNDNFCVSEEDYLENSGQLDIEGNRLFLNTESNGRFHTDWLNMLYPRLKLSKTTLCEGGLVFISIGQSELCNMIRLCDEVFGEKNRAGIVSRQMKTGNNQGKFFTQNVDYIIVYSKNIDVADALKDDMSKELIEKVYNKTQESGIHKGERYRTMGLFQASLKHGGSTYPITCPDGERVITPNNLPWRWNEKTFYQRLKEDEVVFVKTNKSPLINFDNGEKASWNVYTKIWLNSRIEEGQLPSDLVLRFENRHAAKELNSLEIPFDFPKPSSLVKHLLHLITSKDYYVLDFFSGSATTAHAVMQLNAEDGGNRKFIMVQLPEACDEKSEAYKAGYKNICEIGKERIRRAGKKIKEENPLNTQNLDTGFRVLKLDSTNMKDVYYNPHDVQMSILDNLESNIKEDRTPEDLLFQVMLDLGVLLSSKIEESTIAGKKVFNVADNFLIACFDEDVSDETITAVAKLRPAYFVMRDSSMKNDSVATNFDQIFATYSPDTVRKVI